METTPFYQVCISETDAVILPPEYVDKFVRFKILKTDDKAEVKIIGYVKLVRYSSVDGNKLYYNIWGPSPLAALCGIVSPGLFNSTMTKKFIQHESVQTNALRNLIVNRTGWPIYLPPVYMHDAIIILQQNSDRTINVLKYKKMSYVGIICHTCHPIEVCDILVINGWSYQRTFIDDLMNYQMQTMFTSVYIINREVYTCDKLNINTVHNIHKKYRVHVYNHIILCD